MAPPNLPVCFGPFVSAHEIPFPGNRDLGSKRRSSNARLLRRKTQHLMLAGPFRRQVCEAGDAHAVRQPALDSCSDKIGRKKCQRDRHVNLACATSLALCNAIRGDCRIGREFVEPAPPAGDRCNQCCAVFRADRTSVLRLNSFRYQNLSPPL